MSDMKCPFCGKPIRYLGTDLFTCDACHIILPAKHWLAYINTRKALDVAVDALIYANKCLKKKGGCVDWEILIDKALKLITILEQKDKQ